MKVCDYLHGFPLTSQKHAAKGIGGTKFPLDVNKCVNVGMHSAWCITASFPMFPVLSQDPP